MSYPDLGCFAECLTCELCEEGLGLPTDPPDLFPDDWPADNEDPFGLENWAPPDPPGNPLNDFDIPGIGDLDIVPMNPFGGRLGVTIGGRW